MNSRPLDRRESLIDQSWFSEAGGLILGISLGIGSLSFSTSQRRPGGDVYFRPNGAGVPVSRNGHCQAVGQIASAQPAPKEPPGHRGETEPRPG